MTQENSNMADLPMSENNDPMDVTLSSPVSLCSTKRGYDGSGWQSSKRTRKSDDDDDDDNNEGPYSLRGGSGRPVVTPVPIRGRTRPMTDEQWDKFRSLLDVSDSENNTPCPQTAQQGIPQNTGALSQTTKGQGQAVVGAAAAASAGVKADPAGQGVAHNILHNPVLNRSVHTPATKGSRTRNFFKGNPVAPIPFNLPTPAAQTGSQTSAARPSQANAPVSTGAGAVPPNTTSPFSNPFTPTPQGWLQIDPAENQFQSPPISASVVKAQLTGSIASVISRTAAAAVPVPAAGVPTGQSTQQSQYQRGQPGNAPLAGVGSGGNDPGPGGDSSSDGGSDSPSNRRAPPRGLQGRGRSNPTGSPGGSSAAFTNDKTILEHWQRLEDHISQFVEECLVDRMPDDIDTLDNGPFEIFQGLAGKDEAYAMCTNPAYAPYLFQATVWNFFLKTLLAQGSGKWAADFDNRTNPSGQDDQGYSLAMDIDVVTDEMLFQKKRERSLDSRKRFFVWRKETADFIYNHLVDDAHYAQVFDDAVQELLYIFMGFFRAPYNTGDRASWEDLIQLTSDLVDAAWRFAILMRRAKVAWDGFFLNPGDRNRDFYVQLHEREDLAKPRGQQGILPSSKITMTVVPGLVKHVVVPGSDESRDPNSSKVKTMLIVGTKVFVDLGVPELGPGRGGINI